VTVVDQDWGCLATRVLNSLLSLFLKWGHLLNGHCASSETTCSSTKMLTASLPSLCGLLETVTPNSPHLCLCLGLNECGPQLWGDGAMSTLSSSFQQGRWPMIGHSASHSFPCCPTYSGRSSYFLPGRKASVRHAYSFLSYSGTLRDTWCLSLIH
jgi:hypothetical protein